MHVDLKLNGSDYLMLGFDHELRRLGYAGNSCQIELELASVISQDALKRRLELLVNRHPIINARPAGIFQPRWKTSSYGPLPHVRVHREQPGLREKLCDDRLEAHRGEMIRFDLIERDGGRMNVVFTWAHKLMDANSAEHFLAVVGREDVPLPATDFKPTPRPKKKFMERLKIARKTILQLDEFIKQQPRTVGVRFPNASRVQRFRAVKFSAEETAQMRANSIRLCGALGGAQFHGAASMVELHRLHQRVGCPSPSYVLPVPVGLRPKGSAEPLFSNQMTMLMTQFLPEHLDTVANAVATLKAQTAQALRNGLVESALTLGDLSRHLPMPIYLPMLKHGLRGEICSFFYGDTAAVTPLLTSFLGATIEDFTHVGATTPSPGIGAIFYFFRGMLRFTVIHLETHFTTAEADEFAAALRARLLNP